jgi:acyl-CoA synthetase (AMP-forming)/AMP-acid ligase II
MRVALAAAPERSGTTLNVARRLTAMAHAMPDNLAVVVPQGRDRHGQRRYAEYSFQELDQDSDRIAAALRQMGVRRGTRIALLVRPSFDFVSLVFALFKSGAVQILIDPGMGRWNLIDCLAAAEPEGFIAISPVHAIRTLLRHKFPKSRLHITAGRRWFWGGSTLAQIRSRPWTPGEIAPTEPNDPAAIIFTTGSTGPPKGVLYRHINFDTQVDQIRDFYQIAPGEIDLPCFPLFALFNCALGATAVIPDMDPSRPAQVNPAHIVEAIRDYRVTQAFGSPAVWNRVGRYCAEHAIQLPTLHRVLSAGAPVPTAVVATMQSCIAPHGQIHTPYGATESLPVASIGSQEILSETSEQTARGAGICVGRRFSQIDWRIIRVHDGPLTDITQTKGLSSGQIGELIVRGPVVTSEYVTRTESNATAKIQDGAGFWHRMGDVGYLDGQDRFWFCGRMAHRVVTPAGPRYTIPCEAIFNQHPALFRSALVGIGVASQQRPIIIAEPHPEQFPRTPADRQRLRAELRELAQANPLTSDLDTFLFHPSFPVDIRHNAKIYREQLAVWAAQQLQAGAQSQ